MTPLALEMLIWFSVKAPSALKDFPNIDRDPQQDILDWFVNDGIVDRRDFPNVTTKGRAWLEMILHTPQPVQAWLDPRTEKPWSIGSNITPEEGRSE